MRTDAGVQGLTTAATVWVNAAVGVAAGGGSYHLAFIATGITIAALLVLEPVEHAIARRFVPGPRTIDRTNRRGARSNLRQGSRMATRKFSRFPIWIS